MRLSKHGEFVINIVQSGDGFTVSGSAKEPTLKMKITVITITCRNLLSFIRQISVLDIMPNDTAHLTAAADETLNPENAKCRRGQVQRLVRYST